MNNGEELREEARNIIRQLGKLGADIDAAGLDLESEVESAWDALTDLREAIPVNLNGRIR